MLSSLLQRVVGTLAGAHQVAHRLVRFVGYPDRGQLARAMQTRQAHRIAPVSLHPIAWALGNKRRRHHLALMPQAYDLPMKVVSGWTRLVAEAKLGASLCQLGHHRCHRRRLS